jgi:hypothetical protein
MRIKALLATHDLSEEAMPWMVEARSIFDELVIFIDEKRVTPGSVARAQKVATHVHRHTADTWYEWDLGAMARQCESDWVFIIERDEQLSPEWQQSQWRQILETTQLTHLWAPRRWTVSGDRYIKCEPWWPDFQLRLLRNNLDGTVFPTRLHDPIRVPGPGGSLSNLAIHHHALWLCSRRTREDRVRYYEQLRPSGALGHYYLYEDYSPPVVSLPDAVKLDIAKEVGWMDVIEPEIISNLSIELSGVPNAVQISDLFWLDAKVANPTNRHLCALPPFPVRLAYHWINKVTGQIVVFDGNRSGLFPGIPANASMQYRMLIIAPTEPGKYILQTTMVQDGVRWFEEVEPRILQEFALTVVAGDTKSPAFAKTKA